MARKVVRNTVHIRWMIRRDMPAVLKIEDSSFDFPWREEEFVRALRQRNCIGMVAELGEEVVGYMIYELHKSRLHLLSIAVEPGYRRRGIGRALVQKLVSKLEHQRRTRVLLEIRERNLEGQLFFKEMGFRATCVLNEFYEESKEDAYLMQVRVNEVLSSDMEIVE